MKNKDSVGNSAGADSADSAENAGSSANTGSTGASSTQESAKDLALFHLAFARVETEIRAVRDSDLWSINIDVPSTVATALGVARELQQFRDDVAKLPKYEYQRFEKLQDYALALGHVHALFRAAEGSADSLGEIAAKAIESRDILQADATALGRRKLLDMERVNKALKGGNAYRNIAFDLTSLVELFLERWPAIASRTAVRREELDEARLTANRLIAAIGAKEQQPLAVDAATRLRQQAFTLLGQAYDEATRAITFLRWHEGDAASIVPSLYAGRGRRGETGTRPENAPAVPPGAEGPEPDGVSGLATPGSMGSPGSPGAAGLQALVEAQVPPPGFPGAAPRYARPT